MEGEESSAIPFSSSKRKRSPSDNSLSLCDALLAGVEHEETKSKKRNLVEECSQLKRKAEEHRAQIVENNARLAHLWVQELELQELDRLVSEIIT